VCAVLACGAPHAHAGVIFGFAGPGLGGGYRWDAAPRTISIGGTPYERSLNGSLRFSLQGGSYQAYRDRFTWDVVPTVADFTAAVNNAFNAWTVADPVSGRLSGVSFAADLSTPVVGTVAGGGVNVRGAEIDLFGSTTGTFWGAGNGGPQGETFFNAIAASVKLTSGTLNYPGGGAISGADITMNSNPQAVYSLAVFRRILTHEIGHAIGLGDVEGDINPGRFIDDNYNGTTSANALATLTNSWAGMVNIANPGASPLARYTVPYANPGTTTPGVDILMESRGLGIGPGNPVTSLFPLTNDDFGTRQFLYPMIPSPSALAVWLGVAAGAMGRGRARR
jgi:hypothetical protein